MRGAREMKCRDRTIVCPAVPLPMEVHACLSTNVLLHRYLEITTIHSLALRAAVTGNSLI